MEYFLTCSQHLRYSFVHYLLNGYSYVFNIIADKKLFDVFVRNEDILDARRLIFGNKLISKTAKHESILYTLLHYLLPIGIVIKHYFL